MKYYYQNVKNGPNKRRRISICEWVYFDIRFWQTKVRPVCMDHHYYDYYDDDGKWYQAMIFLLQKKSVTFREKKNFISFSLLWHIQCVCVCVCGYISYPQPKTFSKMSDFISSFIFTFFDILFAYLNFDFFLSLHSSNEY